MIVAITGCIGSGKSYILKLIKDNYHYDIYSSDEFVLMAYEDESIKIKLNEIFNCLIDNKIDKAIIKKQLTNDNIKLLNNIIHPFVKKQILKVKEKYQDSLAFIEVPLLFESNMDDLFDKSIVISVDDVLRHQKLKQRNLENYNNMLKLEKHQLSNDEKVLKADDVIYSKFDEIDNLVSLDKIIQKYSK